MFAILMLLFIAVPMIEIGLFIQVGGFLGFWPTMMLVFITAVVGASLVRSQGLATLMSVQTKMQQGEMPAQEIVEGVLLAVAGVLLLTPGFMTDVLGLCILLPPIRAKMALQLMRRVKVQSNFNQFGGGFSSGFDGQSTGPFSHKNDNGDVFDGEFERKDDQNDNHQNPRLK
ncbi:MULTISPECIES: FxsA family protein [unclassified Photobacterium]|uniref:FxsA family protein n=1 Tax=unclassified Photobacterium TaxID=2628852 RepID=UPI001EDF345F|nr:membrane protein FxsA [Photobacterium sp. Ph6]MCG3876459.1 membrane protein FxsA [Photobacterium sp. Ph5]